MNALAQTCEVARQTFLQLVRHKLTTLVLGIAVLAAVVLAVFMPARWAREHGGEHFFGLVGYLLWMQFGLAFVALFFGVTAAHQDLEDRTATYLFLRPVARPPVLLGKWLAATVLTTLVIALGVLVTWLAVALPTRPWRAGIAPGAGSPALFVLGAALAAPGYCAVGVLAGVTFKRPLILAMAFLVGWEVVVSNLPPRSGVRGLTIADPLRRWLFERLAGAADFVSSLPVYAGSGTGATGTDPVFALVRATAVALLVAIFVHSRREYDSRPRD